MHYGMLENSYRHIKVGIFIYLYYINPSNFDVSRNPNVVPVEGFLGRHMFEFQ